MNIDQLKQVDTVVRLGTVSAAADALNMSQSALSRSIARLESEIGIRVFERNGRSVSLSHEGSEILEYVRAILREERLMLAAIDEMSDRSSALLVGTVAPAPLWRLTAVSIEHFPEQLLTSRTEGQSAIERDIINGSIDLGISLNELQYPSIRCCHLMDERISISVPVHHRLATRGHVDANDLAGETFLMGDYVGFWGDAVKGALPRCEFVLQQDSAMLEQMLANSSALAFTSDAPYSKDDAPNRVTVEFDDASARASFYLLMRSDASQAAQDVFDAVERA